MLKYLVNIAVICFSLLTTLSVNAGEILKKTIEQVHQERVELKGKQVTIQGKVVKVNEGILNRNFLHIQDGTGKKGSDDITITSNQTAKTGDQVTVTGILVLNTDFGHGYKYPILIEKSSIVVAK